ncbi:DUF938 domain-containing protein [Magnetospirillum moscoviense]|uniref:SAM-dependent methyltransferase n=1 Tax=Magnetospirillum moscoviense TaxID=1437059 RepID=A0A178MYM6_9PROT|nr:DUF938 domain-containing protein [Magnetospirillum moscoviense]OAN63489.1 SAM-dependent methyltransferase [Magnetospirillum moscoviense]
MKRHSPASERNRDPILAQLRRWLADAKQVIEIASGTGQHAAWFARHLPHLSWQPTDTDAGALDSVAAWAAEAACPNLLPPIGLDVTRHPWPVTGADAVFCANMIHIAPWDAAIGLVEGAAALLPAGGLLILYGPFTIDGRHTAPSNQTFDLDLKARNPAWGVRDLEAVGQLAQTHGMDHLETVPMPANNLLVAWRKRP